VNRLFSILLAGLSLCFATLSMAQGKTPPVQIWQPPRLVLPSRVDQPIQLQSVRIRAEISGRFAQTEIEMTFFNPNRRVLEGELQFPLMAGQSMAGFAMDVNGVLRDAVPVDKARGQTVFEDVIRGKVDPGLLEVTQGNNFKLRVYPIPAQGVKQVVLRIAETLGDAGGRSLYRVPLGFAERVGSFGVAVRVDGGAQAPQIIRGVVGAAKFRREGDAWQLRESQTDFAGEGVLEIGMTLSRDAHIATQVFEGKTYFMADIPVTAKEAARSIPQITGLIWDSSGSGSSRDHGREFALLDAYFRKMRDGDVRLTRIRDVAEAAGTYRIRNGDWQALREALLKTDYDGATNLGAFAPDREVGEYLLFSDGLGNYGDKPFAKLSVPLYTVSAAIKNDAGFLTHVAARSGGRFIDLLATSAADAAQRVLNASTRIVAIDANGATQLVAASPFAQNGRVLLAGVLNDAETTLRLQLQSPEGKTSSLSLPIKRATANSALAASQWARLRINELEGEFEFNRAEIRRLAQRFKLVTRETSLIVLDRVEDYARYEIAPPPELRADYERILANAAQLRTRDRQSHLETIVRLFAEKTAWWNRDFAKDNPAPKEAKVAQVAVAGAVGEARREQEMRRDADSRMRQAPMAAPRMAAPPSAATAGNVPPSPVPLAGFAGRPMQDKSMDIAQPTAPATVATIRLQKWQPDAPYATRLRGAGKDDLYRIYLDEKPSYANSTAFYLDAADIFFDKGLNELGARVLSNLAEMDLENRHILRILGYRLLQAKQAATAIPLLKKVLALSPDEPQSYRDLGLAYAADQQPQRAIDSLYEVVIRPWHNRFPEIELITLAELNSIIARSNVALDTSRMDARLMKNLPLDLRAVLSWDADNTDIDLWVTDPNGEKAYYGNRLTYQGGRMSQDFTGGYGPEEFSLKTAKPGKYKVEAQYFGDRRQNVTGATTLQVNLATHFGTAAQSEQIITLRLKDSKDVVFVGEFEIQ